jgi:hypothetical protein
VCGLRCCPAHVGPRRRRLLPAIFAKLAWLCASVHAPRKPSHPGRTRRRSPVGRRRDGPRPAPRRGHGAPLALDTPCARTPPFGAAGGQSASCRDSFLPSTPTGDAAGSGIDCWASGGLVWSVQWPDQPVVLFTLRLAWWISLDCFFFVFLHRLNP